MVWLLVGFGGRAWVVWQLGWCAAAGERVPAALPPARCTHSLEAYSPVPPSPT